MLNPYSREQLRQFASVTGTSRRTTNENFSELTQQKNPSNSQIKKSPLESAGFFLFKSDLNVELRFNGRAVQNRLYFRFHHRHHLKGVPLRTARKDRG